MTTDELLIWAAGVLDGNGKFHARTVQGPTKPYIEVSIELHPGRPSTLTRLQKALNNGTIHGNLFIMSGVAAFRGAVEALWPYLSIDSKREVNAILRRIKAGKTDS